MRDPKRIPYILKLLYEGWKKTPDIRFGQLIENLKKYTGKNDLFYVEDDDLENYIKDYTNQIQYTYAQDELCPCCGKYSADGNLCYTCKKRYNISKTNKEITNETTL